MEKFKVTNTTIKTPKVDPTTGKDTRELIDRVGYSVNWTGQNKRDYTLRANGQVIVSDIEDGLMDLARAGLVKIERIKDVLDVLQDHTYSPNRTVTKTSKAKVSEMGDTVKPQLGGAETDEAVNPDGDPNFVVKARRDDVPGRTSEKSAG